MRPRRPGPRVIAITGAARGIGLATARAAHAAGHRVALGDIDVDAARDAAATLGDHAIGTHLDVADPASFEAFLDACEDALGPLDVLDNNAGIMPIGPFLDESPETVDRILSINLAGTLNGMRAALPRLLRQSSGHIINTASVAGKAPVPGGLTYAASKAAVISATESARVEFRGRGVHFTCVMPSFTNTDLVAGTNGTRFVRNAEPEDVATAILDVIRRPRPDVYVPRALGPVIRTQPLMGRRLRDAINRLLGADRTFLEIDSAARDHYERRIAPAAAQPRLTSPVLPPAERTPAGSEPPS